MCEVTGSSHSEELRVTKEEVAALVRAPRRDQEQTGTERLFGLLPWLALPIFSELTAIRESVWIKTKDFEPRQFFGSLLQFSRPRAGETLAAKSCPKYLACQFWQGLAEASSKQLLND
jgi:hypothetical protein